MIITVKKITAAKVLVIFLLMVGTYFLGATTVVPTAFNQGYEKGYVKALADVKDVLSQKGISFSWQDLGDGKYLLSVYDAKGQMFAQGHAEVHLLLQHYRDGVMLTNETGAGVLTTIGQDWIEQQISGTSTTDRAIYCADSNDATDPALASWTQLPFEITANGLDRMTGAYTSTGVGTWTVYVLKTCSTAPQSTQLWGLHWIVTDNSNNNLLASDTGPAQKNMVVGDTLAETWTISVT